MKKITLAVLILGAFAASAHAQSNVTVYGIVDAGIVGERGGQAGNVTKVTGGVGSASRLGFKGSEDLGNGLAAVFVLESGFKLDTGESDAAGSLFNRQAYVGLKSASAGTATLGRQYTPYYEAVSQVADPFGAGYAGTAKNLLPSNTRTSNAIVYVSPAFSGFTGEVAYSLGEQAGSNSAGRQIGAALAYAQGPLNARLVYNVRNSDNTAVTPNVSNTLGRNILLAANYDFTVVKAYFAFGTDKGFNSSVLNNTVAAFGNKATASTDSTDLLLGVSVPLSPIDTLMASAIRKNDKLAANQDATQWALGYSHAMSKRTSVYVAFAKIKNDNGANYTVGNNTEAGSGDRAYNVGIRHSF